MLRVGVPRTTVRRPRSIHVAPAVGDADNSEMVNKMATTLRLYQNYMVAPTRGDPIKSKTLAERTGLKKVASTREASFNFDADHIAF